MKEPFLEHKSPSDFSAPSSSGRLAKEPREKMKILFVTYHGLRFGGAEVSTKYLAEGLKKRGHEIIFVSNGHYEGFKNYILKSYTFLPFSLQRRYVRKIVKRVIKEENPDIVHAHDRLTSVGAVQAARSLKVPVV